MLQKQLDHWWGVPPKAIARQFPNTDTGITALFAWLGQTTINRVVFEPTGPYHRIFECQLGSAGVPLVKSFEVLS